MEDDDYLPDFLKEDSVVESPFDIDDMVMPSDYEWTHLNEDFSVENILKLNKEGKNQFLNLTGNQRRTLDKIKDNLYNWDNEPEFSDIFHKQFCKKYGISLSDLRTLERKGLIKLSKDDYYFKERGYIVYPKPLMYLVYISEQDYPDWFIPEAKEKGLWKAESFEAKGYAPDKPFYATTHEIGTTTVMHPIKCGHYKMIMSGTSVWDSPTFYDTIEEMFTDKFDEIMETQAEGMIDYLDSETGQELKRKYQAIKTIGDARKFAKRNYDFKIDFAPCFRKERDYDSKALNALPITVAPIYDEDYFDAESKKMNPLEKAGISGMASGATMEGLETLMAAEGSEEEELSKEQLSAYFARLKDQNPDLAKEIEYSVKEQSYLPRVDINKAGFDDDIIEAWVDLVAVEDDKYAPFERCDECEGEGYVLTSYTSATRFEPADSDGEDCSYCEGTGEIDPAEYMYSNDDGKVGYLAETFEAKGDSEAHVVWKLKGKYRPDMDWKVIGVFNDRKDAVNASKNYSYGVFEEWIGMEEDDERGAETFEANGCVGCQMQKPVSKDERAAIQKQVDKFNEQLALDPDDDFERYILLDLDDENLIEDAFFSRQTWKPLTEAFRKRWGKRSELMDKISIAQLGEKSNWSIYSFEKPFWFEYECDPQDTATAEDPEGYGLGFEFDMTKEEAIEKARQIHKETKGAITMFNNARKRSGGGSTRIHPKFWATPEMMEEQKEYYKREDMEWPTGHWIEPEKFNVEFNEWADQELMSHGKDISFKDWAQDEGMKHGNTEITEWAQHEDESHDARYGAEEHRFMIACGRCGWNFTDEYIKNNTDGNIRPMYGDHCSCGGMVKRYDFEPEAKPKGFFKKLFGKNAETKLSKTSCCCGADEANPCACMKAPEPMECSAKAPKCACYKALEKNAEYDEEDMVSCRHCWNVIGNEKEVYGDETVEYEMANGELVCVPCYKEWMEEYKNDLDPHYSPFYAENFEEKESIIKSPYVWGAGIFALTLGLLSRKR